MDTPGEAFDQLRKSVIQALRANGMLKPQLRVEWPGYQRRPASLPVRNH